MTKKIFLLSMIFVVAMSQTAFSKRTPRPESKPVVAGDKFALSPETPSKDLARMAWEASSKIDTVRIVYIFDHTIKHYGEEALLQQSSLTSFPPRGTEEQYQVLNDVATISFIFAESLMAAGQKEEAIKKFQDTIQKYPSAQSWDPSRGSFWSVAEKSQASIDVLTGKAQERLDHQEIKSVVRSKPALQVPGKERIVDYAQYGEFHNPSTAQYEYVIKDMTGLKQAVGEGVYPNERDVFANSRLEQVRAEGRLKGKHWDFNLSDDLEAAYFKWASAPEAPGVKLFYVGNV
ncbi:MAG: hypothetical protein Q7T18_12020, partial [Sedimentisphaerales bacterium]|nr:hypothetical protein [Sedimentisphaerales bacterium]